MTSNQQKGFDLVCTHNDNYLSMLCGISKEFVDEGDLTFFNASKPIVAARGGPWKTYV
jgi:hypothetical protein